MGPRARSIRRASVSWISPRASAGPGQDLEDLGWDVPADDGQVGRPVPGLGFLDEVEDLVHAALDRPSLDHAVLMDPLAGYARYRDHGRLVSIACVEQLTHAGRRGPPDDVVARKTANGSSPTSARAQRMAWPSPSGSRWRT